MLSVGSPFGLATAPRFGTFYVTPNPTASGADQNKAIDGAFREIEKTASNSSPLWNLNATRIPLEEGISMLKVDGSPEAETSLKKLLAQVFKAALNIWAVNPDRGVSNFTYTSLN